jgi:hypothetical protein
VPRLLSRTLVVLGGAVAATATAWLISSASASADTLPAPDPGSLATGQPVGAVSSALGSITTAPHAALAPRAVSGTSTLPYISPPYISPPHISTRSSTSLPVAISTLVQPANHDPATGVGKVTGALSTAVGRIGSEMPVGHGVAVTQLPVWPSIPISVSTPAGRSGSVRGPAPAESRYAVTAAARPVTTGPVAAVRSVPDRAVARPVVGRATTRHVGHRPVLPFRPVVPSAPVRSPWSPVTVPTTPGGGGGVGGSSGAGGVGLVDQAGTPHVPAFDAIRVVPVTTPLGRVTAGRQPGTTPD